MTWQRSALSSALPDLAAGRATRAAVCGCEHFRRPQVGQLDAEHFGKSELDLRRHIRRLLTKYRYPPDKQEAAVLLVMQQAELFAA